ncbi:hypothetical protein XELAEV_18033043mg [Xenopus laevis]|uniref:Uncharacterized protein n=1 Tax=Xenopus laevis TaxID=8355 RepID=A0A974CIU1_XENLA|nr:hypothetical protein XELAEV_18033043mg [Xenopus laevis]
MRFILFFPQAGSDMDEGYSVGVLLSDSEDESPLPKKRNLGLRVALPFTNRKCANKTKEKNLESSLVKPGKKDSKKPPARVKNEQRSSKKVTVPGSDSEDENPASNQENSSALLKRAMNIKENKAMLAQLLSELNSMPELFPISTPSTTPTKQKKTPRRTFSEGHIERRTNPSRSARPPENFGLENFTLSAIKFAEHVQKYGKKAFLKRTLISFSVLRRRRHEFLCGWSTDQGLRSKISPRLGATELIQEPLQLHTICPSAFPLYGAHTPFRIRRLPSLPPSTLTTARRNLSASSAEQGSWSATACSSLALPSTVLTTLVSHQIRSAFLSGKLYAPCALPVSVFYYAH